MKTTEIPVNRMGMSLNDYGTPDFPIQFYVDEFKSIRLEHLQWHWHKQIEFSYILAGEVDYTVEDRRILLRPGQALFVNSSVLHMAESAVEKNNACMFSVIFDAGMLSPGAGSAIHEKYVAPVLQNAGLPCVAILGEAGWQTKLLGALQTLHLLAEKKPPGFELRVQNRLGEIWQEMVLHGLPDILPERKKMPGTGQERVKAMMAYIQRHFYEPVSLEGIAAAANVSKSEAVRCFRAHLSTTPVDYLLEYRVSKAMDILGVSGAPASRVGAECGFENASYFAKVFRQRTGITPTAYRKMRRDGG